MTYKEFKNAVEDWGRVYNYKTVIEADPEYMKIAIEGNGYGNKICAIHKSERFVIDLIWPTYRNLSENAKNHLYKIVTEFAATPIEDRKDKKDNLDLIINRLEEVQTDVEDVMNWVEEIQERSRNLRNALEDIIIDLEEYKEKQELPYEITDMQGMFAINNTDIPF